MAQRRNIVFNLDSLSGLRLCFLELFLSKIFRTFRLLSSSYVELEYWPLSFDTVTGYSENLAQWTLHVSGKFLEWSEIPYYILSLCLQASIKVSQRNKKLGGCYSTVLSKRLISVVTPEYVGINPSVLFHFSSMDAPSLYQLLTDRLSFRYLKVLKYSQSVVLKLDCDQKKTF